MKLIRLFDDKNYSPDLPVFHRDAARAVILRDGKLAMVHSQEDGYYKFPGGGVEAGESLIDTVIRETAEETGLRIIPKSIRELGYITERRHGIYGEEIFEMNSYFFFADVEDGVVGQKLDGYEAELGYELEWVEPEKACEVNMRLNKNGYRSKFLLREAEVLQTIIEKI